MKFTHACLLGIVTCVMTMTSLAAIHKTPIKDNSALTEYRESGKYIQQVTRVTMGAERYLEQALVTNTQASTPKKLAIVLGVDDTALSSFHDIGYSELSQAQLEQGYQPAIIPVLNFYRYAIKHHVKVFFITIRPQQDRIRLEKNLKASGYLHWNKMYMLPDSYAIHSQVPFRINARHDIVKQGYTVVLTIGDQESDLEGPYTGRKFKLPNPFYSVH